MRAALVLLFALPLAFAAPVPKKVKAKLPDYYPLADGTEWVFDIAGTTEATVRVEEFSDKDGVKTGKLVTSVGGKKVADETIRTDADGVSRTLINATKIDPPVLLIKFGLKDEDEWQVKTRVGTAEVTGTFTLKGIEKVTVPAGEYEAVLVEGKLTVAGTKTETRWWLADGVGIVKLEFTIGGNTSTQELKKYTPGKVK